MAEGQKAHNNRNGRKNGGTVRAPLLNPGRMDFEKADKVLKKIVRENKEWLEEMASR